MDSKFKKPDEETIKRLTPQGIKSLLNTLRNKRDSAIKEINVEIAYYEDLLAKKESANAETRS